MALGAVVLRGFMGMMAGLAGKVPLVGGVGVVLQFSRFLRQFGIRAVAPQADGRSDEVLWRAFLVAGSAVHFFSLVAVRQEFPGLGLSRCARARRTQGRDNDEQRET